MANYNWQLYTGPPGSTTTGQIITYPLNVNPNGSLQTFPDFECFPDFEPNGKIIGTMPNIPSTGKILT